MPPSALQILQRDKENAARYAERAGKINSRRLLERAQLELSQRLQKAEGLGGPGKDSFTASQMRAVLAQVRAVLAPLQHGIQNAALDMGRDSAEQGVGDTAAYIQRAEQEYQGSTKQLPFDTASMVDQAVQGSNASVLRRLAGDPNHPANPGVLQRYGLGTIRMFEESMQQRIIQGKSWDEARADLTSNSPFLQGKPAFWSERILRTESMFQHNAAGQQTLEQVHDAVGGMLKILCATFDHRTGADSIAVHGQVRRVSEAFQSWFGAYMHPPNRPNDREVVVPHNAAWPLPDSLKPRSDGDVAARWALEGRSGSPPARPLMSTVDLEAEQAKAQQPPLVDQLEGQPPIGAPEGPPEVLHPPDEPPARAFSFPPATRFEPLPQPGDGTIPPLELTPSIPELLPPEPAPPVNLLDQQVAPASGSNPGGVFRGSDGVDRYVKFYKDSAQAAGEHLANKVYEKLGLGALKSELFEHEGKLAYASQMLPKTQRINDKLNPKTAQKALEGFAADVLLANWDAAGLSLDNMLVTPSNRVIRVDNGAALLSRAQGTRKPQHALDEPTEWKTFFNPSINPAYSKLAASAGVSKPEDFAPVVIKGIEKIDKLAKRKGGWGAFVDEMAPQLASADRDQIVDMLTTRTAFLRSKLPELRASLAPVDPSAPPKPRFAPVPIQDSEISSTARIYPKRAEKATPFLKADKHLEALETYTGSNYRTMNQRLYNPKGFEEEGYSAEAIAETDAKNAQLQGLLTRAKEAGHAVDGVVYRGVKSWPGLMQEIEAGEFEFRCFASTTTNPATAEGFATGGRKSQQPVLFRLRQKTAVPIMMVSNHPGEREALLPVGVRFRVINKQPWHKTGGVIVDAEEI